MSTIFWIGAVLLLAGIILHVKGGSFSPRAKFPTVPLLFAGGFVAYTYYFYGIGASIFWLTGIAFFFSVLLFSLELGFWIMS